MNRPTDKNGKPSGTDETRPGEAGSTEPNSPPTPDERRGRGDRRAPGDRRVQADRRQQHLGPPGGPEHERRTGIDRRLPGERRSRLDRRGRAGRE